MARNRSVNAAAYDAYLKGRYYYNRFTVDGFSKSIEYFEQAIELDPDYATAYAGLADALASLEQIGAAHGATARQVALRFLVRGPSVFAIPKSSTPAHAAENAAAGDLRLSEAEIARIDAAFPTGPRPSSLPML